MDTFVYFFQLASWMLSLHMAIMWKYQKLAQIIRWTNHSTSTPNQNQNCWPKEHSKCQEWLRNKTSRSFGGDCGTTHLSSLEIWFGLVKTKSEDQDQTERCWKHTSLFGLIPRSLAASLCHSISLSRHLFAAIWRQCQRSRHKQTLLGFGAASKNLQYVWPVHYRQLKFQFKLKV